MFARVMQGRRFLTTAFAAIPVVGSLGYLLEHSNRLSAAEKDLATCTKVMRKYSQRLISIRQEDRECEKKKLIYASELAVASEEVVMGAATLSAMKARIATEEALQVKRIADLKAKEISSKEDEVEQVQLSLESVEAQEILALGKVFFGKTVKRVDDERLLLNPLNHPAAMAFFAVIRKP